MKMLLCFSIAVGALVLIAFGAIGISRVVRWLGLPNDVLALAALVLFLISGICLMGWRLGVMERNTP